MKDKKDIIIFILSIVVVILVIFNVILKLNTDKEINNLKNNNSTSTTSSSTTTSSTTTSTTTSIEQNNEITASEISSLIKDYYKSQNFWNEEETTKWDINNITYLGYYSSDKDSMYFTAKGNFTCKDNADDCVYVEQNIDNTYNFVSSFIIKKENTKYSIKELLPPTFDKQVVSDPDTKKDFVLANTIVK